MLLRFLRLSLACGAVLASTLALADNAATPIDFPLLDLATQRVTSLRQLPARPLLIHVWRSDCAACLKELPWLDAEASQWPGVAFIGVGAEPLESAMRFLKQHPLAVKMYLAPDPALLMERLGAPFLAMPFSAVIYADHTLCWSHLGMVTPEAVRQALRQCSGGRP